LFFFYFFDKKKEEFEKRRMKIHNIMIRRWEVQRKEGCQTPTQKWNSPKP